MNDFRTKLNVKPPRIILTDRVFNHFFTNIYKESVSELSRRTGLPYRLIYNVVNRRIKSVSAREYRLIFKEIPPPQLIQKVDGNFFREMVTLWLFLHDHETKSDLYRDVFGKRETKRVDYRIFSGKTRTIDIELERIMEAKFLEYGLDRKTTMEWIIELNQSNNDGRVAYSQIEPVLRYLEETAGIHPSSILKQYVERYNNGKLKSVSRKVYDRAMALRNKIDKCLENYNKIELEKIKEEVYGKKEGYTLYAEIKEELKFLQKIAKRSPKRYLGRSTTVYEREGCKRITSERAQMIQSDCDAFIQQNPQLKIASIPRRHQVKQFNTVLTLIKKRVADLLFQADGIDFEKHILTPLYSKSEYKKSKYGFTQFDLAPRTLGIRKKVFDLIVATNCEIFKTVGEYRNRWYLSDLYLKELSEKKYFDLIAAKYELMLSKENLNRKSSICMQ